MGSRRKAVRTIAAGLLSTALSLAISACGAVSIPGFTLSSDPAAVTIVPGEPAVVTLTMVPDNAKQTLSGTVVIYDVPPGITYSPAVPTISTGAPTSVTFTVAPWVPPTALTFRVTGSTGLAYYALPLKVTVAAAP